MKLHFHKITKKDLFISIVMIIIGIVFWVWIELLKFLGVK